MGDRDLKIRILGDGGSAEKALGGVGDALKSVGETAAGVFAGGAMLAGVEKLGGKLTDAFSSAFDGEKLNDKLAAQLGLSAQQSESYGRVAGSLYAAAYGESLGEVNDALRLVQQNIADGIGTIGSTESSEEALESVTASVMDLVSAFDQELGPTTRAVGQMIKTGLAVDAQDALDILTVGFQKGNDKAEDLLDTMNEYGTQFRVVGLDGKTAMGLISQAIQAGARDSDIAADAIKEFGIRSKDASDLSAEGFKALGLDAQKMTAMFARGGPEAAAGLDTVLDRLRAMKDPVAQSATAVALFGTQAEDLGQALFAMDPSTAVAALGEVGGAAKRMGETLGDNDATRIEQFKRSIDAAFVGLIGGQVIPMLKKLGDAVGPAFEGISTAVKLFVSVFNGEAVMIPSALGEWAAHIVDFGVKAREAVDKAKEFSAWATEQPEVLAAAGAVVGTVLVAAFVALAASAWTAAAGVAAALWPFVLVAAAVAGLAAALTYAWNNWEGFRNVVTSVVTWLQTNVPPIFEAIKGAIVSFYEMALAPMIGYVTANSEAFTNIGKILLVIAGIFAVVVVAALLFCVATFMIVVAVLATVAVALVALVAVIYNVVQVLWDFHNNARDALGGVIDKIEEGIQFFWDLARNVGAAIADAARHVAGFVGDVAGMAVGIAGKIAEAVAWFADLPQRIQDAVGNLGSTLYEAGKSVIQGLINGIGDMAGAIGRKVSELANSIPDWAKGALGIRSPSSVMAEVGRNVGQGLADGITSSMPAVVSAASRLAAAVKRPFGLAEAASELLGHIRGGGRLHEDLSFEGMSDQFEKWLSADGGMVNRNQLRSGYNSPGNPLWTDDHWNLGALAGHLGGLTSTKQPFGLAEAAEFSLAGWERMKAGGKFGMEGTEYESGQWYNKLADAFFADTGRDPLVDSAEQTAALVAWTKGLAGRQAPTLQVTVNGFVGNEEQLGKEIARRLAAAARQGVPMPWAS